MAIDLAKAGVRGSVEILQYVAEQRRMLKDLEDVHRPQVEEAMGEEEIGEVDGKTAIIWRRQKQRRFNQKAFGEAHPDLLAEFKQVSERRSFEIQDREGGEITYV